ncbi:MAG: glycosyltransferase family 4 protein [Nitrospirae bacterium]|nr:glycosyltransferase family 4 protein [Nitrospirota bacterium]
MKIAYIVLKGMPLGGGIEKYTEELGSRLASRGHEIIVYTMRHYGASNGLYKGMTIKTVPTVKTRSLEKLTASFNASLRQCFEKDVDIVHFHAFGPAMFCCIPRLFGRKVVVQGHGLEWKRSRFGKAGRFFLRLAEFPSVKLPDIVTVVSRTQKKYLLDTYGIDAVYIPPGVNPPCPREPVLIREYGLHGNDYILFMARLVREKGAHYLIEAYNRLETDMKLVIAGDAKHEDLYKSELYSLAEGNRNIVFTSFVSGRMLEELLSNSYLFVLPSEMEGLPIVLLEAMGYGNCCLVSDIPENLDVIDDFGYKFRSRDVDDLTAKLRYLTGDGRAVETVKAGARNHVLSTYLWDRITDQFEALYGKLL